MKKVLFLRKKLVGQNSMEELACNLSDEIKDLKIVTLPYYSTSLIGMLKNGLFARRHQGDVNHIFSITEGYLALFIKGKKLTTVHDLYFNSCSLIGKIAIWIFWIFLPSFFTDKYICISHETKKSLRNYLPWKRRSIKVIYNPLNKRFIPIHQLKGHAKPCILHIGTARHKNLDKVILALKNIDCKLVVIGKLFDDQKRLLIDSNIDYINDYDIDINQLINYYREADIVSFPSSQEGFGMIIIESNAMQKPIIAGDIPVLHEIGGNAALYVNPQDEKEIKTAINLILNNQNIRLTLIKEGILNANRFNVEKIASLYDIEYNN